MSEEQSMYYGPFLVGVGVTYLALVYVPLLSNSDKKNTQGS